MYRHCTTEKTSKQQLQFQEALLAIMQECAYNDISVVDLCNSTGLSRNVFYRLFDCKDDVLLALIDHRFLECNQFASSSNIKKNLTLYFTYWRQQEKLLYALEKENLSELLTARATLCFSQIDFGLIRHINSDWKKYDKEILTFYIHGFVGLLLHWYRTGFARSEKEMFTIAFQFLDIPPFSFHS